MRGSLVLGCSHTTGAEAEFMKAIAWLAAGLLLASFVAPSVVAQNARLSVDEATKRLQGTWQWTEAVCGWIGKKPADRKVQVTFSKDLTFSAGDGTRVLAKGQWQIPKNMSPIVQMYAIEYLGDRGDLDGRFRFEDYFKEFLSFKGNQVVFSSAFDDGCDFFFDRQ